jgi:hypothetical protein
MSLGKSLRTAEVCEWGGGETPYKSPFKPENPAPRFTAGTAAGPRVCVCVRVPVSLSQRQVSVSLVHEQHCHLSCRAVGAASRAQDHDPAKEWGMCLIALRGLSLKPGRRCNHSTDGQPTDTLPQPARAPAPRLSQLTQAAPRMARSRSAAADGNPARDPRRAPWPAPRPAAPSPRRPRSRRKPQSSARLIMSASTASLLDAGRSLSSSARSRSRPAPPSPATRRAPAPPLSLGSRGALCASEEHVRATRHV